AREYLQRYRFGIAGLQRTLRSEDSRAAYCSPRSPRQCGRTNSMLRMRIVPKLLDAVGLRQRRVRVRQLTLRADGLRDARRYADAAEAYRALIEILPQRIDLRVQYGNMLKDSGQLAKAEAVYRSVLTEMPDDADTYLQ